ncbi:hypothetical protein COW49_01940 [Candidatus Kaiserbacteria bacterium CG17_big_fil_post_rev_8_21_14_2_50_51_7]|uniref:DUF5659 domain-containing protein n=1 Tax=Candidatus Kaiserbacteria bacterium CG17_big_fil_post_rev_8_21_14_2_50_51_7 TaxID=1974613 RepID=A0A2M7FDR7_9BACT|nr:MAG: hypothetical protein COW49_01940 [Candidatus Kaiserbacteria bacterium CG17_big_fil_post_rev_8_21_14_2_50_51_7]
MTTDLTIKDIYFCSALLTMGAELDSVDRRDPQHIRFKFKGGDELKEIESEWINGTLTGSLSDYAESIRKIKSLIHARE